MKDTIIKYLTYIINKLEDKPQVNTKSISSLAPKILTEEKDLKRISPYTNILKDVIDAKGITNIALTGIYGSGKSTILQTFQHYLYPTSYKYINISLASFKDNKYKSENFDKQLEISILQQIFYHSKPSKVPDSRFNRIINLTSTRLFILSFFLIIWILSALTLFKFDFVENLNPNTWDLSKNFSWTTLLSSVVFFSGIGSFSRIIIRFFTNSKINKLNIRGEVELSKDIDKSVFNEHLEEIIYFFQRTKKNVVIIEDLDRCSSFNIFSKLKELNVLLNNSELIEDDINFIYAVKDELLKDKTERVKFFEYIIPVIPFINPSNAAEQLTKLISESDLEGVLSSDFTEDVVTFIDDIDMRLLTNIVHEYVLYRDNLKELNQNKLFAMIAYKNIFPDDFGKLHKREGWLYGFISNKRKYVQHIVQNYKEKILKIKSDIEKIESEKIDSIEDLRRIYLYLIFSKKQQHNVILGFVIDTERIPISNILQDSNFHKLIGLDKITYYYENYAGYENTLNVSFSSIEGELHKNFTYIEREKSIIDRNNKRVNDLKIEITNIQNEISETEYWGLTKIIQEVGIDIILNQKQNESEDIIANNKKENISPLNYPLVRNLLLNGYIDENYNDYISIFHGINMTSQDFAFIQNVKSGTTENFNYTLTNIDQIIKKLSIGYFKREEILNFDLLDYLLQNHLLYKKQYISIIDIIKKETNHSLRFMDEYIHSSKREYIPLFIQKLSENWINFWDYIHKHPFYTDPQKDYYLFLILIHAKLDSIYTLNKSLQLANYIETHDKFISLFTDKDHFNKLTSIINKLNIYFDKLELPNEENEELFQYFYENNHYYINRFNIELLLNKLYKGHSEGVACWNYTTILNSDCEPLKNYIEDNLTDYLEKVFLKLPHNVNESEETILLLLNNNKLPIKLRAKIIDKEVTKITDNSKSKYIEIDTLLFEKNKLKASWNNIINYFDNLEENVIDDALIKFLNIEENYNTLNQENISKKNEEVKDLETQLIYSNQLSIEAYKSLVIKTPYNWDSIDFSSLDPNKVEWLIENKLNLTKYNFDKLKHDFILLSIRLLEKHFSQLLEKYDELELDIDDHVEILESIIINQSIKERIILKIDNKWIIENDTLKVLIKNILYQSSEHLLEYEALDAIVEYSKNNDKRLHLIYNHIGALDNTQIQSLLEKLGYNYKNIFQTQRKPTFSYSPTKENIFKLLETKGMISSCKVKEDKSEIKVVALYK